MRWFSCAAVWLLILLSPPFHAFAWQGKVVSVADGDTITVLNGKAQIRVRLYGIDTPEKKQPFGNAAKKFTLAMVAGKSVEVEDMDIDKYGRTVGLVSLGSTSLNEELIKNGYAWVYRKYCRHSMCSDWYLLEEEAREGKVGLWRDGNPVAPWDWRRGKRNQGAKVSIMPKS